ncbi:MAG: hypothetical protein HC933_11815 [Pleurocapsa sp. SU_196_0]|nr:hypothetical protein [Pleurocapsa sp. SU_196_0]
MADTDIFFNDLQKPCFASAGNATGRTLMAWTERKTNNYTLRVSQYDPVADSFDTATSLATNNNDFNGNAYRCQIAISSNNDAMVIWWLRAGTNTKDLFWSRRAAGSNAWSTPALLATASTNFLLNRASELQLDANGNASLVWLEQHAQDSSSQLRTARYSPSGNTWTTGVLVAPVLNNKLSIPSFASDSAGNQMVLYKTANQGAGSPYPSDGIYVQKFDLATTTWLAPTLIKTMTVPFENPVTSDQVSLITLKIGVGGHAVAMWRESGNSITGTGSAKMNPSGVWINLPNMGLFDLPALEVSATGVATTVFYANPSNLAGQGVTKPEPLLTPIPRGVIPRHSCKMMVVVAMSGLPRTQAMMPSRYFRLLQSHQVFLLPHVPRAATLGRLPAKSAKQAAAQRSASTATGKPWSSAPSNKRSPPCTSWSINASVFADAQQSRDF